MVTNFRRLARSLVVVVVLLLVVVWAVASASGAQAERRTITETQSVDSEWQALNRELAMRTALTSVLDQRARIVDAAVSSYRH